MVFTALSTAALSRLSRIRDKRDYPEDSVIPSCRRQVPVGAVLGGHSSG